jgi:hypothetical protein
MNLIRNELIKNPQVRNVQVKQFGNDDKKTTMINIIYNYKSDMTDEAVDKVAREVLEFDPEVAGSNEMIIVISNVINFNISTYQTNHNKMKAVAEWRNELKQ